MKTTHSEAQQWWNNLPAGERRLICAIARMLNGPRLYPNRPVRVAPAAETPAAKSAHENADAAQSLPSPHPMGRGIKGEGRTVRTPLQELIRAAANWENGIGSFIKLRIIHQRPFRLAPKSPWLRVEGKAVTQAPTKPIAKSIPSQWSDGYIPRRRNLCRQKPRF